ncbi:hypothetical protein [Burkholderia gladioli]|uniref:hypothetical protein n=1 Tax=Burkholderia gladioli TaxID=28095 RepID=UPI001364DD05|nr:hypothetical protein [Burkholderia gladioli]KAF1063380.1 hypothetical protein LvStA_02020 [Burkholderia gladioli]MDN7603688.1 hypothetical protein [Burkholderia gladioli]MDN7812372.1 hypothetical protein [Burkholderia gladioli]WAG19604.1 hypothetical protein DX980_10375 [Burkholderia gladioli]
MALFEMASDSLKPVPLGSFGTLGLRERTDIQRAVRAHIEAITPDVRTKVIAEEFGDWAGANRRIDLLCVDENANLVVVELKRDDGAHMDLQALRYAAMISTMRFEQAVDAHRKYLAANGSDEDPEQALRDFLEVDDGPVAFTDTVRIILASANFSAELTTAVLWLNKQGNMDIRCVQMRPHAVDSRVLLDIQQVIPLPQAAQYTVALREKSNEQQSARTTTRDTTRYDVTIGDAFFSNLPKRRLMLALVREAIAQGRTPEEIRTAIAWRKRDLFISKTGHADEATFQAMFPGKRLRYFFGEDEMFFLDGTTYVLSRAWSDRTPEAAEKVKQLLRNPEQVSWEPASSAAREDEVETYAGYTIRRTSTGVIELERDGEMIAPVKPVLLKLAEELGVSTVYESGTEANTQQLGKRILATLQAM